MKASAFFIGGTFAFFGNSTLAQTIVPDATLGVERSVVTSGVDVGGVPADRIEGGAVRGTNLFHSFSQFNVGELQRVYFANPLGIINILTRVTGNDPSNILGTLGVTGGNVNLFLINPNGIIFGPNARLDIDGSFFVSTASSFKFPDGSEFSATNPTAPPLLTVNVTPGVQWGASSPGATITNRGNLAPGQDLTLFADKLDLQGQLQAGRDLTLLGQDRVKVRDSVTTPFLALSDRNLTVQGNQGIDILALNHPTQTPFVSGGNLSLISDGIISGDARFSSGGSFSIRSVSGGLANFVSENDPIISASGDVDVAANYTGASLLVESKGNIRFRGNINISGPDTSTLPDGPDTATLSSGSALIMRSGQSSLVYGRVNSGAVPAYSNEPVPAGITIGGKVILQPFNGAGGIVSLSAASGNVSTRLISTNGIQNPDLVKVLRYFIPPTNDLNGGQISLIASNGSITTDDLYSFSFSGSGSAASGGQISLEAGKGSISTGDLLSHSFSYSGNGLQGGAINLVASKGSITTGDLVSYSSSYYGNRPQGGTINLVAANGINITGDLLSFSSSYYGSGSQGGAINLVAANGINITGDLLSFSAFSSGFGGAVDDVAYGGTINLVAANGNIHTGRLLSYSAVGSGFIGAPHGAPNGGAINLVAANGSITTGDLISSSSSISGSGGQGGAINLVAANGSITTGYLGSPSLSESASGGQGATINLLAANDINITGFLSSYSSSESGNAAQGGAVNLVAANNINIIGDVLSYSSSGSGSAAQGGEINLVAANGSIRTGSLTSFSFSNSGSAAQGGNISIRATNSIALVRSEIDFNARTYQSFPGGSINSTGALGSGNITIASNTPLALSNSVISSDTFGSGRGGEIYISAPSISLTGGAQLSASTHSSGSGGNISLIASESVELSGAVTEVPKAIFSTQQTGLARIPPGTFLGGFIPTGKVPLVPLDNGYYGDPQFPEGTLFPSGVFTQTTQGSTGSAGNISIETGRLIIKGGAAIATTTFGQSSNAGNISVLARDSISLDNGSIKSGVAGAARGNSGNITVNTNTLSAVNGGQLLTSTSGDGQAGDITVSAKQIQLSGANSGLFAQTSSTANAGNLTLQPRGEGQTFAINFWDGAQISASTSSTGRGGNLTITAPESITLTGNGSLISAETSGSGIGGDLTLQTGTLIVRDGAKVTVSGSQTGNAGNMEIIANSVLLDNGGKLIAETTSGEGGNIKLQVRDLLLMRRNSLISTSAGTASAGGNGGNITISAPFVVAVPIENSDIRANAYTGTGGRVDITASGIFGLQLSQEDTPLSDITASSEYGVQGTVTLNTPNVDPSRGLINLPTEVVDASNQIAQKCRPGRAAASKQSSFVVTGRGGLPPNPTEALSSDNIQVDWVSLTPTEDNPSTTEVSNHPTSATPAPLVEAQGWVMNEKGQVVLTATAPTVTPHSSWHTPMNCDAPPSTPIF